MNKTAIYYLTLFVVIMAAQAVVFNNLVLFNCAMPFVFVYLILSLPVTLSTNLSLLIGFATGVTADVFADTYGLNALCCTLVTFLRKPLIHLYIQRDDDLAGQCPGMKSMGAAAYLKYAATMVPLYCLLAFVIEDFAFFGFWRLIVRIVASSLYTLLIIYAIDSLSLSRREKKL